LPESVFGSVEFGTTSNDNFGGSALEIGGTVGYQLSLKNQGAIQLCPLASLGIALGPKNAFNSGVDRSRVMASVGLAVATSLPASRRMKIVPSAGISYSYRKDQAESAAGVRLFQIADGYAVGQVGIGLLLDSNISIRPGIEIPFSMDINDPSFGLTVSYNFGRKR
jgi:hypothetical protein